MPFIVWGIVGLAGLVAGRGVIDEIGDTTDRIAPPLMMIGGSVAVLGAGYLLYKASK